MGDAHLSKATQQPRVSGACPAAAPSPLPPGRHALLAALQQPLFCSLSAAFPSAQVPKGFSPSVAVRTRPSRLSKHVAEK